MDLERGTLARVDRKLLAGLQQDEVFKMVRIPVSMAKWSTWKRYCDSAGISMGRAIVALIDRELANVSADDADDSASVLITRLQEQLAAREVEVADRERGVEVLAKRLQRWSEELRHQQGELEAREHRAELRSKLPGPATPQSIKAGRNESCPCGSGLKYKRCHGLAI